MTQQPAATATDARRFRRPRRFPPPNTQFHGAWLGAGAGATIGAFIVAIIQTYLTHKALPAFLITGIDGLCSAAVAAVGAWLTHVTPKP